MPDNGQHIESVLLKCEDCDKPVPVNAKGEYLPSIFFPFVYNGKNARLALHLPNDLVLCRKCKLKWMLTVIYFAAYGVLDEKDIAKAAMRARDILKGMEEGGNHE
jgi:hypothetical protein